MAEISVSFYDYNGVVYAFGIISGLENVKAVRMYLSNGYGTTYQYYSTQIYNKTEANILDEYGENSYLFNVRTDRDAEDGALKQLPYDITDPVDGSGKGHYKFSFEFYNDTDKEASSIDGNIYYLIIDGKRVWYQMHNNIPTPKLSFDESTNTARLKDVGIGSGRYIIEVKRKNRNKVNTEFDERVKDYAYTVNMKSIEGSMGGKYTEPRPVWQGEVEAAKCHTYCRYFDIWEKEFNIRACVLFDEGAGFSKAEKSEYFNMAKYAFSQIKEIIEDVTGTEVSINIDSIDNSVYTAEDILSSEEAIVETYGASAWYNGEWGYPMIVRVGNSKTLGEEHFWGGYWSVYAYDEEPEDNLDTSFACVDVDYTDEPLEHVFGEEIFQSLHIGGDNFEYPLSRHWDPHYANPYDVHQKDSYNDDIQWDRDVLRFFYSRNLNGYTPVDLINEMDTPCCLYKDYDGSDYYEFDLSGLNADDYILTGWVADVGENYGNGGTWSENAEEHYNWDGGWDDAPYSLKTELNISISHDKPLPWYWTVSNGSATAAQTALAEKTCLNKGYVSDFSYLVWNDLVEKAQEFLDYTGRGEWTIEENDYGFSSSTLYTELLKNSKMKSSDKTLTALRFNILRFCIGAMQTFNNPEENNSIYQHYSETGRWDMKKGEEVLGSYFIDLAKKINQI